MAAEAKPVKEPEKSITERVRGELEARLKEVSDQLGPLQQEKAEIEGFLTVPSPEAAPAPRPQAPRPRQRRRRSGGTVEEKALKIVSENPEGITATEIADKIGIKPNYLYRVLGDATKDKKVEKKGTAYLPVAA